MNAGKVSCVLEAIAAGRGRCANGQKSRHARCRGPLDDTGDIGRELVIVQMGVRIEEVHFCRQASDGTRSVPTT